MKRQILVFALSSVFALPWAASQTETSAPTSPSIIAASAPTAVPPLVPFPGLALDPQGKPLANPASITFLVYADETGGDPLFAETQSVAIDAAGHYKVQLGATLANGLPQNLFSTGEARWLEVQITGQTPQPRVLIASVPYALKAADAETIGGLPPSAFVRVAPTNGSSSTVSHTSAKSNSASRPAVSGTGTTDYIPLWTNSTGGLGNSGIFQGPGQTIGIGTTATTAAQLTVESSAGVSVAGFAGSTGGDSVGVEGTSPSSTGTGVVGLVTSTSGNTIGVAGQSESPTGIGVTGLVASTSGNTVGVKGTSKSPTGDGVWGVATSTSGSAAGVYGTTASSAGIGVAGVATSASGRTYGVSGTSGSSNGVGVAGFATSTSGASFGVEGKNASSAGAGVFGEATNTSGDTAGVEGTSASPTGEGVLGEASDTNGVNFGVQGASYSSAGTGVAGVAFASSGVNFGVQGTTASVTDLAAGVFGEDTGTTGKTSGVKGGSESSEGAGVLGVATSTSGVNFGVQGTSASSTGTGVLGDVSSASGNTIGVQGQSLSSGGVGVVGRVIAASAEGKLVTNRPIGTWGDTAAPGGAIGVLGTADDGIGMVAANNSPTGYATLGALSHESANANGQVFVVQNVPFKSNCVIDASGNLGCSGTVQTAVPLVDGRKAALYAVEAPENWFEDAGSGKLSNGMATVSLDLAFAETVNAAIEYHVFLTPQGECEGLYVGKKTPQGFEVRELHHGHSDVNFDYRIIAHRKGYEAVRLADVTKQMSPLVLGSSKH